MFNIPINVFKHCPDAVSQMRLKLQTMVDKEGHNRIVALV